MNLKQLELLEREGKIRKKDYSGGYIESFVTKEKWTPEEFFELYNEKNRVKKAGNKRN